MKNTRKYIQKKVKLSEIFYSGNGDMGEINSDDFKKYGEVIKLSAEKLIGE